MGFFEYGQALRRFDRLVAAATADELVAFDDIVKSRDEHLIYINLSRRMMRRATSLDEKPEKPGDNFSRRGLAWIMALARVEVGSVLAAFTEVRRPYASIAGNGYDAESYREMLQDALRSHYWALANDPRLKGVAREFVPNQASLAYLRRMTLLQALFKAALQAGADEYTPVQIAELRQWKKNLDDIQMQLIGNAQIYFAQQRRANELQAIASQCQNACSRLDQRAAAAR